MDYKMLEDLYEIWEWDGDEKNDIMLCDFVLFKDISKIVEEEITDIHENERDGTIPYDKFEHKDSTSQLANVVFNLPKDNPDTFPLMRMSNGPFVFGLTAWKMGKNPNS